jgi:IstB-like ATP binding protein
VGRSSGSGLRGRAFRCERWRPSRHSADDRDRRSDSQESDTRHYGAVSSGTGKTHAALALGLAACQKGYSVAFTTAASLVHELMEARDERRLRALQKHLNTVKLLVVDELGYVPFTAVGSELLFEVFSQRYERGSTIVTSNLPFDEWTSVFGSERLTGALLDRLTHHVHILEVNGESFRLATSKKAQRRSGHGQNAGPGASNEGKPIPSKIPALAEPWFLTFQADVEFRVVMSPDDLKRAGLDELGKQWELICAARGAFAQWMLRLTPRQAGTNGDLHLA